jgi:hypothetical protein
MSKRDLKNTWTNWQRAAWRADSRIVREIQPCKVYYNFVFNPKEETLTGGVTKFQNEYFPLQTATKKRKKKKCVVPLPKYIKFYHFGRRPICSRCNAV